MLMKKKTPNLPEEEQKCQKTVQMWYWEVVGEYLITLNVSFLPFKLQKWDFFTGLGCSCFRQIYCSPLLEDLSGFPVEKSKERKANLQGKIRLQWVFHVPKLLLLKEFSWLDLVPEFGFQSQGSHVGLGCCREQEKKKQNRNCFGSFGIGAASWTLLGSSCVLQRITIQFLCVSKEFQHFSSVSSWWKSSHLISEWRELLPLEGFWKDTENPGCRNQMNFPKMGNEEKEMGRQKEIPKKLWRIQ